MIYDLIIFWIISAIAIIGALGVVIAKEVVRSVMWLALAFLSMAGLYILLNAEYLAIIQILVYVGAIGVVILFGVMLTKRRLGGGEP